MDGFLKVMLVVGLLVWGFLLWDRAQPRPLDNLDDANTTDRCAEFRQTELEGELGDGDFQLGYQGRIRQLLHGCF